MRDSGRFMIIFSLLLVGFSCVFGALLGRYAHLSLRDRFQMVRMAILRDDAVELYQLLTYALPDYDLSHLEVNSNPSSNSVVFKFIGSADGPCARVLQEHGIEPRKFSRVDKFYTENRLELEAAIESGLIDVNVAFFKAARDRSTSYGQMLLSFRANLNYIHIDGTPVLHNAVHNSLEYVEFLVNAGASLDALDSFGETALDIAIKNKKTEIAEYLLKRKSSATRPLYYAFFANDIEIGRLVVKAGFPVDEDSYTDYPLFCEALEKYKFHWINLMLKAGVNVNRPCGFQFNNALGMFEFLTRNEFHRYSNLEKRYLLMHFAQTIVERTNDLDVTAEYRPLAEVINEEKARRLENEK